MSIQVADSVQSDPAHGKEVATYEEMVKIEPQVDRPRPIFLVGE